MGKMKHGKRIPLSLFYLKYFVYLFLGVIAILGCTFLTFNLLCTQGVIYPANYAENQALEASVPIRDAKELTADMIPGLCRYAVFEKDGDTVGIMTEGTIEADRTDAAKAAINGTLSDNRGNYYRVIERETEYCVLSYRITPQYTSPVLRKTLPLPQNLLFFSTVLLLLLLVLFTALRFGRALRRQLSPLLSATDKIKNRELDFSIESASIREIDTVLQAMDDMKNALKASLETQWQLEQAKAAQMSALAHDLKTPLTLIRGNAELLDETGLTGEQREYTGFIEKSALQMQDYVKTLIEVTKSETTPLLQKQNVEIASFLSDVQKQMQGLCNMHHQTFLWDTAYESSSFSIEPSLLTRALMNICTNACEHTPVNGTIRFSFTEKQGCFLFLISDTGCGFSRQALLHAKEQFFMDDKSRTSSSHYGMGLYIVDTIVRQHGGILTLENDKNTQGARVLVEIPV